jgi:hypothetical protein
MFERFRRKQDAAREDTRAVDTRGDADATAVRERDAEPVTTVAPPEERAAAMRARGAEPATTVRDRDDDASSDRFARDDAPTTLRDRDDAPPPTVRDRDDAAATAVDREPRTFAPVVGEETVLAMHDRQRVRFGGIRWGSAFFGLLSAIGLAAVLLGIVAAAGVAIGVSQINDVTNGDADTIGLGGAILVLAILALSWFCGGYVAARMARFDGMRQGLAVWAWTVLVGVVLAVAALIGGSDYDVFAQLNLPNVAIGDQTLTTGGAITLAAACVVTLIFAIVGGKAGDRFHRRVDRFAAREYVQEP